MKRIWLQIGCFLIGYNYNVIKNCSELSIQRVRRYTAAVLIIGIIWAFVGFEFTQQYITDDLKPALLGGLVSLVVIINIERLIILSTGESKLPLISRVIIAFCMALIGSLIVDQIFFQKDIEQKKDQYLDQKITDILRIRTAELRWQIHELDSLIDAREMERTALMTEITTRPFITKIGRTRTRTTPNGIDSLTSETVQTSTENVQNPARSLLAPVEAQLRELRARKVRQDSSYLNLRAAIEQEVKANVGFLEEFEILIDIILSSWPALILWIVWIVIILGLETLVLFNKVGEKENDYDRALKEQMDLHLKRLSVLAKQRAFLSD